MHHPGLSPGPADDPHSNAGCEYVMNHTIINDRRDCCAALCYAEDSAGKACGDIDGATKTASSSNVHATALAASAWLLAWLV